LRKFFLIAIIFAIVMYAYVAINEKQKELVLNRRVPQIRKVNKYEFSRALYQIREAHRAAKMKEEEPKSDEENNAEENVNDLEKLKKEPSNPAIPVDDQDFYPNKNPDYQEDYYQQEEYNNDEQQPKQMRFPKGIKLPKRFTDEVVDENQDNQAPQQPNEVQEQQPMPTQGDQQQQ
jgi:hypothetical protein